MSWRDQAREAVGKNRGDTPLTKPTKPPFVSSVSSDRAAVSPNPPDPHGWGYTPADLKKMDSLLRELAELEGWTPAELEEMLDRRRRMAPARVPEVLKTLQAARDTGLATWPQAPAKRSRFSLTTLTVIEGGKGQSVPSGSSKTPVRAKAEA
jgi:hypothetical protein